MSNPPTSSTISPPHLSVPRTPRLLRHRLLFLISPSVSCLRRLSCAASPSPSLLHPHVSFRLSSRPLTTTSLRLLLRRLPLCCLRVSSALSDTCLCLLPHRHLRSTPSCIPLPSSLLLRLSVSSAPLCSHLLCPTAGHNLRPPPATSTLLRHLPYCWHYLTAVVVPPL